MATTAESKTTTNHDEIRQWAEERGAQPSCVKGTGGKGDIGMLRLDFPGYSGEDSLEHIGWDDWFEKFDERNLALLHQDTTAAGQKSNFNKLVSRETAAKKAAPGKRSKPAASKKGSGTAKKTAAKKTASKKTAGKAAASSGRKTVAKKTGNRSTSSGKPTKSPSRSRAR